MTRPYAEAGISIREDLLEAHRFGLDHVTSPGTWFDGTTRAQIAAESRAADDCALCRERRTALSPTAVAGSHDGPAGLEPAVIDVIHRIRSDPARLSRGWFDGVVPALLSPGEYAELVGVTTMMAGIDYFARALGVPPAPLPEPREGEPSHHVPAAARDDGAWLPMIPVGAESGPDADVYGGCAGAPNIVRSLSLVPDQVRAMRRLSAAHYFDIDEITDPSCRRDLGRLQIELVAARVSAMNECFY